MNDDNNPQGQDGNSADADSQQPKPIPEEEGSTMDSKAIPSEGANNGDYDALVAELEDSKTKLTELTQISQHALADLQNYKKRSEEEKSKFVIFANSALITNLLPILDNMTRATTHIPEENAAKEWTTGIIAIFKQLEETLKTHGLQIIPTIDEQFDPNLHEAVMTEDGPPDKILKEVEKGYKIADRVLRRSKVVVGNQTDSPSTESIATKETKTTEETISPELSPDAEDSPYV